MELKTCKVTQFKITGKFGVYENVIGICVGNKIFVYRVSRESSEWLDISKV